MASPEECREALERLSANLSRSDGDIRRAATLDRSLTCWITDLDLTFSGRLSEGRIRHLTQVPGPPAEKAQLRLAATSDDLLALVDGSLHFASAWAHGRIRVEASFRDLLRLRSLL